VPDGSAAYEAHITKSDNTHATVKLDTNYTITATSLTDGSISATVSVGVTDLAGVYTYHNDLARDGVNAREFALAG